MQISGSTILIIYELGHLAEARLYAEQGIAIICLDYWIECELKKNKIQYVSLEEIVRQARGENAKNLENEEGWYAISHAIAREWHRTPAMKFFEHAGIRIAEVYQPIMEAAIARLMYYVHIFELIKRACPKAHFRIPSPTVDNDPVAPCLAYFVSRAIIDAARMIRLEGVEDNLPGPPPPCTFPRHTHENKFLHWSATLTRRLFRRGLKIYASVYWSHIESLLPYLPDVNLVLTERPPWRKFLAGRASVMSPNFEIGSIEESNAMRAAENFLVKWKGARGEVAKYLKSVRSDLDWTPVLHICEYLVAYAPRVIADIDVLRRIMTREKPDLVLLTASVGDPRHHHFLIARVAGQLNIPSIELQHATVTIDPRSVYSPIETNYLATYGPHVDSFHERLGQPPSRLIPVGSPRFDIYTNEYMKGYRTGRKLLDTLGLDTRRPVLFVAVPSSEAYINSVNSYQLAEFFDALHAVQKNVSGLQVLLKFRISRHMSGVRAYLKELFPTDMVMTGDQDIFPLLCASDAVVCNNSTVIYQAVLVHKPLVLYPWKRFDTYHAEIYKPFMPLVYEPAEVIEKISRIFTDLVYRDELLVGQKKFLEGYSFDGKSSSRVAELIRKIAQKHK